MKEKLLEILAGTREIDASSVIDFARELQRHLRHTLTPRALDPVTSLRNLITAYAAEKELKPKHLKGLYEGLSNLLRPKLLARTVEEWGWFDQDLPPTPALLCYPFDGRSQLAVPLGRVGMIAGGGGVGKTESILGLAVSVATGRPWFQEYEVAKPGRVFLGLGEEGPGDIGRRLVRIADELGLTDGERALVASNLIVAPLFGQRPALIEIDELKRITPTIFQTWLREQLEYSDEDWSLVVFDPASRFMGAETETDNKAATEWIEVLESLAREAPGEPTVLFAHHVRKSERRGKTTESAARGSSALTDGVRVQINLERCEPSKGSLDENALVILRFVKSNYGRLPPALTLERGPGGVLRPHRGASQLSRPTNGPLDGVGGV